MKIIYVKGDLLECPETYILHGCNAQGVMGSGVAKAIREKYPKAYKDYKEHYNTHGLDVGLVIPSYQDDGRVIFNAITQKFYGHDKRLYLDYESLSGVITGLNYLVYEGACIAMPKIGAGLAGGDWSLIEKIIEEQSFRFQPVVYVKG